MVILAMDMYLIPLKRNAIVKPGRYGLWYADDVHVTLFRNPKMGTSMSDVF